MSKNKIGAILISPEELWLSRSLRIKVIEQANQQCKHTVALKLSFFLDLICLTEVAAVRPGLPTRRKKKT